MEQPQTTTNGTLSVKEGFRLSLASRSTIRCTVGEGLHVSTPSSFRHVHFAIFIWPPSFRHLQFGQLQFGQLHFAILSFGHLHFAHLERDDFDFALDRIDVRGEGDLVAFQGKRKRERTPRRQGQGSRMEVADRRARSHVLLQALLQAIMSRAQIEGPCNERKRGNLGTGSWGTRIISALHAQPLTDPQIERGSAGASCCPLLLYTPSRKVLT
jgi:hypothetical protein